MGYCLVEILDLGWRSLAGRSSLPTAVYLSGHYTCLLWSLILCQALFKAVSSPHSGLSVQQRLVLQPWLLCSHPLMLQDLNATVRVKHGVWELESCQCFCKRFVGLNPHSILALLNAFLFFSVHLNSHCRPNRLSHFVFNDRAKVPKYFSSSPRNICNFFS